MVLIHHSCEQEKKKLVLQALPTSHVSIYMNFMSKNFALWNIFLLFKVFPTCFHVPAEGRVVHTDKFYYCYYYALFFSFMFSQKQGCLKLFPTHIALWPTNSSTHELSSATVLFVFIHRFRNDVHYGTRVWCTNMNLRDVPAVFYFRQNYFLDMNLQS